MSLPNLPSTIHNLFERPCICQDIEIVFDHDVYRNDSNKVRFSHKAESSHSPDTFEERGRKCKAASHDCICIHIRVIYRHHENGLHNYDPRQRHYDPIKVRFSHKVEISHSPDTSKELCHACKAAIHNPKYIGSEKMDCPNVDCYGQRCPAGP